MALVELLGPPYALVELSGPPLGTFFTKGVQPPLSPLHSLFFFFMLIGFGVCKMIGGEKLRES